MALLPDATAFGERPTPILPRRTPQVASYQPTSGFEMEPGRLLEKTGANVEKAAQSVENIVDYQSKLNAENAFTQLRNKQFEMTYGDNGFKKVLGQDAVKQPLVKNYGSQFDQTAAAISSTLSNDYEKTLFKQRAQVAGTELRREALAHVMAQRQESDAETLKSSLEVEAQHGAANPDSIPFSVSRVNSLVSDYGATYGKSKEWIEANKTTQTSALYAKTIENVVDSNPGMALRLFNTYKDSMTPNDRVLVGHRVNQAVLPAQAAAIGDFVVGGRDPQRLDQLNRTLDTASQSALQGISDQLTSAAPGDKGRQIKAQLGEWEADARKAAQAIRPNDAVFEEMAVQQVKNRVSTLVAAEEGKQRLAYTSIVGAMRGVAADGTKTAKPQSTDELFALPGMKTYFDQLEPNQQGMVYVHLNQNANEAIGKPAQVSARLLNTVIFPKIVSGEIYQPQQLAQYVNATGPSLTIDDHTKALAKIEMAKNPEGKGMLAMSERVNRSAHSMLLRSIVGSLQPEQAEYGALLFRDALDKKIEEYRAAKKDIGPLLTAGSPDYFGTPQNVMRFMSATPQQAVADAAGKQSTMPPRDQMTKLDATDPEKSFTDFKGGWFIAPDGRVGYKPLVEGTAPAAKPTAPAKAPVYENYVTSHRGGGGTMTWTVNAPARSPALQLSGQTFKTKEEALAALRGIYETSQ